MKRTDSFGAALLTVVLLVCGLLCGLLAAGGLAGLGWDVSGCDGLTKLGIAFGAFLACILLGAAVRRVVLRIRIRRLMWIRRVNYQLQWCRYDGVQCFDFRDLPHRYRRQVRREVRETGGVVFHGND